MIAQIPLVAEAAVPSFPPLPTEFLRSRGYMSQLGQDFLLDQMLFGGREGGTFVDIGAHDGINLSNSYYLEAVRRWGGLCVEPNPKVFARLAENRKCKIEQAAVGSFSGEVEFTVVNGADMLSGVTKNFNRRHRARIKRDIRLVSGSEEVIRLPMRTLQSLLDDHGISRVDVLTIDTEGSEMAVLQGIDFDRTRVSVVIVERNYESGKLPQFLRGKGFVRLLKIGWDDVYVRADFSIALGSQ